MCARQAVTEADCLEEDIDAVGSVKDLGLSGYESEEFTLPEIPREKRLAKKLCPRVLLTPLIFLNVSLQIFNKHQ